MNEAEPQGKGVDLAVVSGAGTAGEGSSAEAVVPEEKQATTQAVELTKVEYKLFWD